MSDSETVQRAPVIIVADDQEWTARALESALESSGYSVLRARSGAEALQVARTSHPDALIVSHRLRLLAGADPVALLRTEPRFDATIPILVTTTQHGARAQRLSALRAGAWDLLLEPLDAEILLAKLHNYLSARSAIETAREQGMRDALTGLYSATGLGVRAREMGAQARRRHDPLACVVLAPDPALFRGVPRAARAATAGIAERLGESVRRTARASDALGRVADVEFGIVAPDTNVAGVQRMVERYRTAIESMPGPGDGAERAVRLRAGYCVVADFAASPVEADAVLSRARQALRELLEDPLADEYMAGYELGNGKN